MSHDREATAKLLRRPESSEVRHDGAPESRQNGVEDRLRDVLARVREDARADADAYARDTEVPAGGE